MAYDVLVYAVGYEQRSQFAASTVDAEARVALVLDGTREFSFDRNLAAAEARSDKVIHARNGQLAASLLESLPVSRAPLNVALDVSSMTRAMMASALLALSTVPTILTVLYCPGEYHQPPRVTFPFVNFNPVEGFEGWSAYPELPLSMVVGLGYEVDVAIGAIEQLDPSGVWAFAPKGPDERFFRDVVKANASLEALYRPTRVLDYALTDPQLLYVELRSLLEGLVQRSRVVLVPGGPKLFSAVSLLAKLEVGNEVSVWRVSSHGFVTKRDIMGAGYLIAYEHGPIVVAKAQEDFAVS